MHPVFTVDFGKNNHQLSKQQTQITHARLTNYNLNKYKITYTK